MTTESTPHPRKERSPLLGALGFGGLAVLALVVTATVAADRSAVVGAAVGGLLTLAVFASGVALVGLVAKVMPSASLLVALMTYTLQLLALAVAVAALEGSGLAGDDLSRGWFAAAVIVVTLLWLVGQLLVVTRSRIPAYDLPADASGDGSGDGSGDRAATGRTVDHPGGER